MQGSRWCSIWEGGGPGIAELGPYGRRCFKDILRSRMDDYLSFAYCQLPIPQLCHILDLVTALTGKHNSVLSLCLRLKHGHCRQGGLHDPCILQEDPREVAEFSNWPVHNLANVDLGVFSISAIFCWRFLRSTFFVLRIASRCPRIPHLLQYEVVRYLDACAQASPGYMRTRILGAQGIRPLLQRRC